MWSNQFHERQNFLSVSCVWDRVNRVIHLGSLMAWIDDMKAHTKQDGSKFLERMTNSEAPFTMSSSADERWFRALSAEFSQSAIYLGKTGLRRHAQQVRLCLFLFHLSYWQFCLHSWSPDTVTLLTTFCYNVEPALVKKPKNTLRLHFHCSGQFHGVAALLSG